MARLLARTFTLARPEAAARLRPSRALSNKIEFVEIDLSEESPASSGGGGGGTDDAEAAMRRLQDAIRGALVRQAAPDWLPFVPGGSYWVPPTLPTRGVANVLSAAVYASRDGASGLTEEETMCLTNVRGWPSAAYFVEGKKLHPVKRSRKDAIQTDDEES